MRVIVVMTGLIAMGMVVLLGLGAARRRTPVAGIGTLPNRGNATVAGIGTLPSRS